jgi:hypothetical protein
MEIIKKDAICARCGKAFERKAVNQVLCYDPCQPVYPHQPMRNPELIHTDCIMFRESDGKQSCSGLNALYCAYGSCNFYKMRSAENEQSNSETENYRVLR